MTIPVGEVPEAIARIARPLRGDGDLDHLLDLVAPARIVLLGEASHGSHEFYDLRATLTRKLIADRGFTAVAIEGDWPDAMRVDRYVRHAGDDASASEALAGFERFPAWMWRNADVASFVEWLHGHNGHLPAAERAGFYGIDLYSLFASMAAVVAFLDQVDPRAAARARERYACFDHVGHDPRQYGLQTHFGLASDCEDEVVAELVELQRRWAARSRYGPEGDAWFLAMENAHVVRDAEAYYRTMFGGRNAAWNLRDTHMADTLDVLVDHLGTARHPAKLVVWAHNSHVGDARATEMGKDGQISLGQLVRQRRPEHVALVGFTTDHGTVQCARDWDEPGRRERVRASLPGSWEELFRETGIERFAVSAAALRDVVGEHTERLHRAIGVVYRPETERRSHYYHSRLAEQYDLIIHLDESHAVHPLPHPEAPAPGEAELPETYPTGM